MSYRPLIPIDPSTLPPAQGEGEPKSWWSDFVRHHRENLKREWDNFAGAAKRDLGIGQAQVDEESGGASIWRLLYVNTREQYDKEMRKAGERFGKTREGKNFIEGAKRSEIGRMLDDPMTWLVGGIVVLAVVKLLRD